MPKVQVLTVKGVKAAARRAYRAGRLTAQHRNKKYRMCEFKVGDSNCAIGAALNKTTMNRVIAEGRNGSSVGALKDFEMIGYDYSIAKSLIAIQSAHDEWATSSRDNGAKSVIAIENRKKFLDLICA